MVEAENNKQIFEWLITRPLLIQTSDQSTKINSLSLMLAFQKFGPLEKAQDLADEVSQGAD